MPSDIHSLPYQTERDDGVFADIIRYILFGIVRTHGCAVIDIFFKNVSYDIRINITSCRFNSCIKVPVPLAKEVEYPFEGVVPDLNLFKLPFQYVDVKKAAIKIGNITDFNRLAPCFLRFSKSLMKELEEEISIKTVKSVFPLFLFYLFQLVLEIVQIVIKISPFLDKIAEHEPAQHQ
ncbi:MAG: hypothetical protein MRK02_11400 [Candidatus Scalindua sp.]|nr:hypothetical protein [Candidatus Scalindua sp.]